MQITKPAFCTFYSTTNSLKYFLKKNKENKMKLYKIQHYSFKVTTAQRVSCLAEGCAL